MQSIIERLENAPFRTPKPSVKPMQFTAGLD